MTPKIAYFDASALVRLAQGQGIGRRLHEYIQHSLSPVRVTHVSFYVSLGMMKRTRRNGVHRSADKSFNQFWALTTCLENSWITIVGTPAVEIESFANVGLDVPDALQLASVKLADPGRRDRDSRLLITAHDRLARVAREEGFLVWNCAKTRGPG